MTSVLSIVRTEGVPILIVAVLLLLYSIQTIGIASPSQHLETMTAMVVAFYFGGKTVTSSAESVRASVAAATNGHMEDRRAN